MKTKRDPLDILLTRDMSDPEYQNLHIVDIVAVLAQRVIDLEAQVRILNEPGIYG